MVKNVYHLVVFIITNQMWGQIAKPLRNYVEGGYLHRLLFLVIAVLLLFI